MIKLDATTAIRAIREAHDRFPGGARIFGVIGPPRGGWSDECDCVYIALVRPHGDNRPTATAVRNRAGRPTAFFCEPLDAGETSMNDNSSDHLEVSTSMALLIGWARRRLETQEEQDLASLQKPSYEKP